jgi:hypothetical protein
MQLLKILTNTKKLKYSGVIMKINIKELVMTTVIAATTFSVLTLSSCKKDDDKDDAAAAPINALALSMNANCDGEPCM